MLSRCKALPGEQGSRVIWSHCASELQSLPRGMCQQRDGVVLALDLHTCRELYRTALPTAELSRQVPAPSWPSFLEAPYTQALKADCMLVGALSLMSSWSRGRGSQALGSTFLCLQNTLPKPLLLFCPHHILLFPEDCQQFRKQHRKKNQN